ncbi:MAG: hypothetical protein ABIO59_09580 [Luteimonas sp.]
MNRMNVVLAAATVLTGLVASGGANAVTVSRVDFSHASGFCQGALPSFDTNIRKRPLAVANEGTATAFVSCSMEKERNDAKITEATLKVFNRGTASADVSCTLVHGFQSSFSPTYISKTATVDAGGSAFISWLPVDNAGANYSWLNWSCSLPPGTDIGYGYVRYTEDVGA